MIAIGLAIAYEYNVIAIAYIYKVQEYYYTLESIHCCSPIGKPPVTIPGSLSPTALTAVTLTIKT